MPRPRPHTVPVEAYNAVRRLKGRCIIMPDVDELIDTLGDDLFARASRAVLAGRPFHLALSGGSTPQALYQSLVIDPRYRLFPWDRTHVWMVDERSVDVDDDRSNFRMIREILLQHIPIDPNHVHPMPATARNGDRLYDEQLARILGPTGRLDFTLLGMGADGHTASLFPHSPALSETRRRVVFNSGDTVTPPRPRLTLTFPFLNASFTIAVLVTGEAKRPTIQRLALAHRDLAHLPITGIEPNHDDGELVWYLDEAAVHAVEPVR